MTTVGKHFFMAQYGSPQDRAAHLDAAFSKIPEDHEATFKDMKSNPNKNAYVAAWSAISRRDAGDVVDRSYAHPNHIIRSLAVRAASAHKNLDQLKKIVPSLSKDPHPYVVGQVVKYAPGLMSDEVLNSIADNHPDPEVRGAASRHHVERYMFK
jgi:hypothetical protein